MPTLEWIGKDKVVNHHQQVPYRVLEAQYTHNAERSDNMIIRGDNLEALKSLLPMYEGKIKCIYIDPPYNTGNEGWVYNDNVNDPKIKKWLGEVVGKEGEDLSRHDKWLCMMYPRLKILHRLLADDGAIFISISDVEHTHLRMICDEIFGRTNLVANVIWENNYSPRNDAKGITYATDNVLAYSKNPNWEPKRLGRTDSMDARYSTPDRDPVPWTSSPAHAPGARTHKGMVYAIQHPYTGEIFYPPADRHWALEQAKVLAIMQEWADYKLEAIDDADVRAQICGETTIENIPDVMAVLLNEPLESAQKKAVERYNAGCWPTYYFTSKHGEQSETRKMYEALRREISAALTMYARFFHNPIDIAQTEGHQLPQDRAEGSRKLRELASQLRALSETMPEKVKDMPITRNEMYEASKYLIGLSNSFTTPYGTARSAEERNGVREYEAELRKLLNISEVRG